MLDESVLENNDVVVPVTQSALPSTVKRKAKDNVKKTSNKKAKKESRLLTDTRTAIDGIMGKYVEDESIKVKDEVADDEDEDAYN